MGWALERLWRGLGRALLVVSLAGAGAAPAARAQSEARPHPQPGALASPGEPADPAGAGASALEDEVRAADALLREARFEEALERTDRIRADLGPLGDGAEARHLRVRTEVVAATAHVALEHEDAARGCFRRALDAEPALDLDPAATAPKVLRVFRAVRAEPR
jgi:hypothetical protein